MDDLPPIVEKVLDSNLAKIHSTDLREAAAASTEESRVVIVELDLPRKTLARPHGQVGRVRVGTPRFQLETSSAQPADVAGIVADTSAQITQIIGKPPETYFSTSESFVIEATGGQIAQIAEMPAVSAIWPNAQRRIGR